MLPERRKLFLQSLGLLALKGSPPKSWAASCSPKTILLRSSWQVVNIGDIAHTPGVLALIERHIPGAVVILWASGDLTDEVAAMEHKRFPNLRIVKGSIREDGSASNPQLQAAVDESDCLVHGSGPSLVAAKDVASYAKHYHKPFGVYGITYGSTASQSDDELLNQAKFVYFRDSVSLKRAKERGIRCPILEFAPDGAFACDLRNEQRAREFLQSHDLQEGRFMCCLSRLRYTPYWTIRGDRRPFNAERHERNQSMKEQDHSPLREAIIQVVRKTDLKVLLCPEDMTQMAVGKELLFDPLPSDVKKRVIWRDSFWLTDEALSVYVRSAGLFGSEMHSPIMAIGNGVPAIVCRFEEQTSKGFMWNDIGLGDWLFDFDDDEDREQLPAAVLQLAMNKDESFARALAAKQIVERIQTESMQRVKLFGL